METTITPPPSSPPPPPGTILAGGVMIGLAIVELGFLMPGAPGRFVPHGPWNRLTSFLSMKDALLLVVDLGRLVGGFGVILRWTRWTHRALMIVLAHGVVLVVLSAISAIAFGFFTETDQIAIGLAAWETLIPFVILFGVLRASRRRNEGLPRMTLWRGMVMAGEGVAVCLLIGASHLHGRGRATFHRRTL